jgi:hypothetical protein
VLWLVLQAGSWLAVFVVASSARSPFGRRRGELLTDETLIDLDELPPPTSSSRIAGEVLGAGIAWAPDVEPEVEPERSGADAVSAGGTEPTETVDDAELGRTLDELAGPA